MPILILFGEKEKLLAVTEPAIFAGEAKTVSNVAYHFVRFLEQKLERKLLPFALDQLKDQELLIKIRTYH